MGYEYGRKIHAVIDTDSFSIQRWRITTASIYDKNIAFEMIDTNVRRGIVKDRLTYDRKMGIGLKKRRLFQV